MQRLGRPLVSAECYTFATNRAQGFGLLVRPLRTEHWGARAEMARALRFAGGHAIEVGWSRALHDTHERDVFPSDVAVFLHVVHGSDQTRPHLADPVHDAHGTCLSCGSLVAFMRAVQETASAARDARPRGGCRAAWLLRSCA